MLGYHGLWINQPVNWHVILVEKALFLEVGRGSYSGDLHGGTEQGITNLTGDHIDFIAGRNGNQHFCVVCAGPSQYVRV